MCQWVRVQGPSAAPLANVATDHRFSRGTVWDVIHRVVSSTQVRLRWAARLSGVKAMARYDPALKGKYAVPTPGTADAYLSGTSTPSATSWSGRKGGGARGRGWWCRKTGSGRLATHSPAQNPNLASPSGSSSTKYRVSPSKHTSW
jgi:hypothetical protein